MVQYVGLTFYWGWSPCPVVNVQCACVVKFQWIFSIFGILPFYPKTCFVCAAYACVWVSVFFSTKRQLPFLSEVCTHLQKFWLLIILQTSNSFNSVLVWYFQQWVIVRYSFRKLSTRLSNLSPSVLKSWAWRLPIKGLDAIFWVLHRRLT